MLPSDFVIPCPLFPGTFSVAPMPSSPLLSVTSGLLPSKPGASTFPRAEDSAPLLAYTRTKGQKQWNTPSPHQQPSVGPGKPQVLCLLGGLPWHQGPALESLA